MGEEIDFISNLNTDLSIGITACLRFIQCIRQLEVTQLIHYLKIIIQLYQSKSDSSWKTLNS